MRGILEGELIEVRKNLAAEGLNTDAIDALITLKVRELQEPWMTLDEFLKSGFDGQCWVYSVYKDIFSAQFIDDNFISINTGAKAQLKYIERVMPIHKPEPPS